MIMMLRDKKKKFFNRIFIILYCILNRGTGLIFIVNLIGLVKFQFLLMGQNPGHEYGQCLEGGIVS
jgi:hypothetical protein